MLIGNVGNDPELKHTPSGIPVASFRLATSENRKDRDGNPIEHTDWHSIVAWRGLAEIVERLVTRGSRIFIEGKLQTRNYEDKTGNRRRVVEIVADTILMLDKKQKNDNYDDFELDNINTIESKSQLDSYENEITNIEDIPF